MNGRLSSPPLDLSLGDIAGLDEVVNRDSLRVVGHTFFDLFNLSLRVYSADGSLLANVHEPARLYGYLQQFPEGRRRVEETVDAVKRSKPQGEEALQYECFTGAVYDVVPITYQGRQVGRFVLGPYVPAELLEVPKRLVRLSPDIDRIRVRDLLMEMPRVKASTAVKIARHLRGMLDLLIFSSHRAHLTSEMHVASVRESFRELAEKTSRLQTAYDRLKELDQLKSNFLATVSHELRTPLTSIIGYSEMLEAKIAGDLNDEQHEFVQTIHQKGNQLLGLITSLLDLSKLEQGATSLSKTEINPRLLMQDLERTFAPQARKKDVSLTWDVPPDVPLVEADPIRLKQILGNLAENAIKFTPAGGQVIFEARSTDWEDGAEGLGAVLMGDVREAVAFTVRDTGIGMPSQELGRIFDAFYQVDGGSTREHGGTGLGLSIVKRLVDAHGGRIEVESEPGHGTSFTVVLPRDEV